MTSGSHSTPPMKCDWVMVQLLCEVIGRSICLLSDVPNHPAIVMTPRRKDERMLATQRPMLHLLCWNEMSFAPLPYRQDEAHAGDDSSGIDNDDHHALLDASLSTSGPPRSNLILRRAAATPPIATSPSPPQLPALALPAAAQRQVRDDDDDGPQAMEED